MADCCTCAADITRENRNRRHHRSKCTFTWSTESWISVSHVSEMLKSLSALITAERELVLCSNQNASYIIIILLAITISKHHNCFVMFLDVTRSDWTAKILTVDIKLI